MGRKATSGVGFDTLVSAGKVKKMGGLRRGLLIVASFAALTVVALGAYFLFAAPNLISLISFFIVVPVFLILGLGFFRIARDRN